MANALSSAQVEDLATKLIAARQTSKPMATPATGLPETDADAYRVQNAVMAKLGRRAAAWKVGAASPTSEPNCAPIFDTLIHDTHQPVVGPASTGVELEIAFTLGRAFPAAAQAPSRADVEAAIVKANIVLETCEARLAEGMQAPALTRLADNGINHGLVIGPIVTNWREIDAKSLNARVEANGASIVDLTGGHTAPDLVGLLTWLVGHCVKERGGLDKGTVVTTGSWSSIRFAETPTVIKGTFSGLGSIEVRLARQG